MHKKTAKILGIKINVCSCIDVAVCKIPMNNPIIIAVSNIGNVTAIIVHIAPVKMSDKLNAVKFIFASLYGIFVKLFNTLITTKFQPSAMINNNILNGREIIIGGSIIIPIASKTLETTMSTTKNGM